MPKTNMKIFFDLDGTLLDASDRLYYLFRDIVSDKINISYEEYWSLKRQGISHKKILIEQYQWTRAAYFKFHEKWMNLIEHPKYLAKDILFNQVPSILKKCNKKGVHLCIVTNRQCLESTKSQLKQLNILELIDNLLVTEQSISKEGLIKRNYDNLTRDDFLVGDTGKDIQAARNLALQSVAVLSGFLSQSQLLQYHPDFIYEKANDFVEDKILI